jgi:hypothetical protein
MKKEKMMQDDTGTEEGTENEEDTGSNSDAGTEASQEDNDTEGSTGSSDSDSSQDTTGKPEWMADRIWNEKFSKVEGDLDMAEVAEFYSKSYDNATEQLHNRKDVIRGEIEQELMEASKEGVPASSNDYEFDNEALSETHGLEVDMEADDPLLIQMKTWAHNKGLTQHEFQELSDMHLEAVTAFFPDWDTESEKLGAHAEERAGHLNAWMGKVLSPDSYKAMENIALSADVVVAMEELMGLTGVVSFSSEGGSQVGTGLDRDALKKLMATDEYQNGDPATLQKVQAGWKKLTKSA